MMEVYSYSAKGKRNNNEDYILSRQITAGCTVHLLADGMGGYLYGELASNIVCQSIAKYLENNLNTKNTIESIRESVNHANMLIGQKRKELQAKLGTTLAGILVVGSKLYFFWLGDVRIYHFQNDEIIFQSEDHSLVNDMRKQRIVSTFDLERYKNVVTRSIQGAEFEEDMPIIESHYISNDTLILCTDGFWQNWNVRSISDNTEEELNNTFHEKKDINDDNFSFMRIKVK